jgi:hypothetical protein
LAERCPRVWHVIEAEGLPAARRLGLLPAASLRSLAGAPPSDRNRTAFERLMLPHLGDAGAALLRFQQMEDARLLPTLHGCYAGHPGRWRAMLDRHVFFWAAEDRLSRFVAAVVRERRRAEPQAPDPVILQFETAALLAEHGEATFFTTINSGSTAGRGRAHRDENTFRPVAAYKGGPVAELAIPGKVAFPEKVTACFQSTRSPASASLRRSP